MQTHLFVQTKAKTSHHWFQWHIYKQLLIGATLNGFNDALILLGLPGQPERVPKLPTMLHQTELHLEKNAIQLRKLCQ